MVPWKLLAALPPVKGVIMAVLTAAIGLDFVQSLIVAIVSASLSGLFLLIGTTVTVRAARENRDILHDVKRKLGATQRAEDEEQ